MFKTCPQCTSTSIASADGHRYFCSACNFEYFHNTAAAVAAFIVWNDKLLVTRRAQHPGKGLLDLPGGFVDHNESLEVALTRELQEELNVEINQWRYVCSQPNTYEYNAVTYKTCDCAFEAVLTAPLELAISQDEISEVLWCNPQDIPLNDVAFPSIRQLIQTWLAQQRV